jgi:hypothetical protein
MLADAVLADRTTALHGHALSPFDTRSPRSGGSGWYRDLTEGGVFPLSVPHDKHEGHFPI